MTSLSWQSRPKCFFSRSRALRRKVRMQEVTVAIANVNRDPKKSHAFKPADFNPHHKLKNDKRKPEIKVGIEVLKQVFVDRRPMT